LDSVQNSFISAVKKIIPEKTDGTFIEGLNNIFAELSEEEKNDFSKAFSVHGKKWGYQQCHLVAKKLLKYLIKNLFGVIDIQGHEHCLEALKHARAGKTVVMIGNHLSYGDVNYLHAQLELNDCGDFPFLVMAGPKVYSEPFRLLSSMVFESLKMAQPPSKASDGAGVSRRELLEITRLVVNDAIKWQDRGRILYFFPEGTRSRSGELNEFISGVSRYIERKGTLIYPIGYTNTEGLLGANCESLGPLDSKINVGPVIDYDKTMEKIKKVAPEANHKKFMVDLLGFHISELIDPEKRGHYSFPKNDKPELNEVMKFYLTERHQ
jgi:1-acyl-sn-glycerol-3-phosphate acyltransferase